MSACKQCGRPAFYHIEAEGGGSLPLCIDCWRKVGDGEFLAWLQAAAMANQAADDIDAMLGGFGASKGGRIPVAEIAKAMTKPTTTNHITIRDSTVGASIAKLTQAIIDAADISVVSKRDLLDLVQTLGEQAIGVQGSRSQPVVMAIYKAIEERAKGLSAITDLVAKLGSGLAALFGS